LDSSRTRYPAIFLQSAEVGITKNDSKSAAYENRTKSVKSGGLEKDGRRERILALRRGAEVQSFVREGPVFIGDFCALASRQRMFCAVRLAEGAEPESNILCFVENYFTGAIEPG